MIGDPCDLTLGLRQRCVLQSILARKLVEEIEHGGLDFLGAIGHQVGPHRLEVAAERNPPRARQRRERTLGVFGPRSGVAGNQHQSRLKARRHTADSWTLASKGHEYVGMFIEDASQLLRSPGGEVGASNSKML